MNDVELRRQRELLSAPAPLLAAFFARQTALLRILREEDVGRCGSYMFGEGRTLKTPSARATQAAADAFDAEFKAIRAGIERPQVRPSASEDDMEAWAEAFAAATPARAHQAYLDDPMLTDASDEDRCSVAIGLFASLAAFSDETAVRLYKALSEDEDADAPPSVAAL